MRRAALLSSVALLFAVGAGQGQSVGAGFVVQSYSMSDVAAARMAGVQLLASPFEARVPVGDFSSITVGGAFARGVITAADGVEHSISALTDTRVRIDLALGSFRLSGHAALPTGDPTLTLEEAAVAGTLASDLLPFAVRRWGSGGAFGGDAGVATRNGRTTLQLSAGIAATSSYAPVEATPETYQPGAQFRVRGLFDLEVGLATVLSVLMGYQRFQGDVFDGLEMYEPGDEIDVVVSVAVPLGARESFLLYGGLHARGDGLLTAPDVRAGYDASVRLPLGPRILGARDASSRQVVRSGGEVSVRRGRVTVVPAVELRVLRAGDGLSQGWLATAGGSADYLLAGHRFGRALTLSPFGRVRIGNLVVAEGSESAMTGWEVGLGFRAGLGR